MVVSLVIFYIPQCLRISNAYQFGKYVKSHQHYKVCSKNRTVLSRNGFGMSSQGIERNSFVEKFTLLFEVMRVATLESLKKIPLILIRDNLFYFSK